MEKQNIIFIINFFLVLGRGGSVYLCILDVRNDAVMQEGACGEGDVAAPVLLAWIVQSVHADNLRGREGAQRSRIDPQVQNLKWQRGS
jgi:hypothetical protein